jgi:hypothetical protein
MGMRTCATLSVSAIVVVVVVVVVRVEGFVDIGAALVEGADCLCQDLIRNKKMSIEWF